MVQLDIRFDKRSKKLIRNLEKRGLLEKVSEEIAQRIAMDIAREARAEVQQYDYTKSGRKSIRAIKGNIVGLLHMAVLNVGRRAGKMPPVSAIADWVSYRKIPVHPFVIARSIGRKGTKGKFFMRKAAKKALDDTKKIQDYIERAIGRQLRIN